MTDAPPVLDADTKLAAVLARWPHLAGVLAELSPAFRALDNPFLRGTFARVATLRQVARAGGVPLDRLVGRLRDAAGLPALPAPAAAPASAASPRERPAWATDAAVRGRRDARPDVAAGVHPLPFVIEALEALPEGAVFELTTPFVPAPVIDLARRKGFESWSQPGAGAVRTWFRRAPPSAEARAPSSG